MSIISEALRKAEKSLRDRPQTSTFDPPAKNRSFRNGILFLLILFLAVMVVRNIFHAGEKNDSIQMSRDTGLSSTPAVEGFEPASVISQKEGNVFFQQKAEDFRLTGIALMEEESFAVINGDIFKKGDIISGAELTQITQNEVTLSRDGKEKRLTLK